MCNSETGLYNCFGDVSVYLIIVDEFVVHYFMKRIDDLPMIFAEFLVFVSMRLVSHDR